ncbi:Kinase, CAMK CAMKL [Spironucleus salmonicida]|uniref:non-specific serine/threonine protein kinase n=1 Tax=Spironucleus salmonicida TaxID=348837 RepID=V6LI15_9EUKA|nr:Kinase, CAMK CAMKL [Spironucleus salmonicida]|eukprot:EST44205.1 Kinase, CAMK CAMKL [Spironucleus salmonicida]
MAEKKKVGPYTIQQPVGKGAYAEVYLVTDEEDNMFAMKVIKNIDRLTPSQLKHIKTEIKVMKTLKHPNIVRSRFILASKRKLYIVMDFIGGGNLLQLLQQQRLPLHQVRRLFIQGASAMEYCHLNSIAHRDIKAENILMSEDHNQLFISDFGLSAIYNEDQDIASQSKRTLLRTSCGSPYYVAPEVLKRRDYDGQKADIWSTGILLFLMLLRRYPFDAATHEQLQEVICKGEVTFPQAKIDNGQMPLSAVKLIKEMLTLDAATRPTFADILKSDFVAEDKDYLAQWTEICTKEIAAADQEKAADDEEEQVVE